MTRNEGHIRGELSEFKVATDLIENGCRVSYTHGQYPYDLIADFNSDLFKVQVKTAKNVKNRKYRIDTAGYDEDDVDLFAGYAVGPDEVFYVPFNEAGKRCSVTFTPRANLNASNAARANLAEEYTFKNQI